jgi:acyl carrier protein
MDSAEKLDMAAKIKDALIAVLDLNVDRGQLADDVSLYSPMVQMDSLTLLHLLVTLEKEFDIEIDDEDVMNANLSNIGNLVDMIQQIVAAADGDRKSAGE